MTVTIEQLAKRLIGTRTHLARETLLKVRTFIWQCDCCLKWSYLTDIEDGVCGKCVEHAKAAGEIK